MPDSEPCPIGRQSAFPVPHRLLIPVLRCRASSQHGSPCLIAPPTKKLLRSSRATAFGPRASASLRRLRRLKSHLTSAELHARLLPEHENLSQKTVYEILDACVQAGLASRLTAVGEPYRYEARREPHYHATCRVCGRLYDVPASADSQIRGRAHLPGGFPERGEYARSRVSVPPSKA